MKVYKCFLAFWVLRSSYFITKARSQKLEKKTWFSASPCKFTIYFKGRKYVQPRAKIKEGKVKENQRAACGHFLENNFSVCSVDNQRKFMQKFPSRCCDCCRLLIQG